MSSTVHYIFLTQKVLTAMGQIQPQNIPANLGVVCGSKYSGRRIRMEYCHCKRATDVKYGVAG